MSCVCRSHVGECGVGHVLFSSPNLDATNLYFSFPEHSPKDLCVSKHILAYKTDCAMPVVPL